MIIEYIYAFLIGGLICVIGQILLDIVKLTPAHVMCTLVVAGAVLDGIPLGNSTVYDKLIDFAGAGATVPITSFGHALVHGAIGEANARNEIIGIITGIFELTSAGISSAIIFSFLAALVFKPRG